MELNISLPKYKELKDFLWVYDNMPPGLTIFPNGYVVRDVEVTDYASKHVTGVKLWKYAYEPHFKNSKRISYIAKLDDNCIDTGSQAINVADNIGLIPVIRDDVLLIVTKYNLKD